MSEISILTALLAGVVSFLSPCVLPLVPGYLSYITGLSLAELSDETTADTGGAATLSGNSVMRVTLIHSTLFVTGFTTIFVLLGASATTIGRWLLQQYTLFNILAGSIVILFGLHIMGVLKIPFLYREKRLLRDIHGGSLYGSYGIGMAFAFGWTPCIGPILAGVLTLAATRETVYQGMGLLMVYSLGLGVPFLLASISVNKLLAMVKNFGRMFRVVEILSGLLLVGVGLLIWTGGMTWLAQKLAFLNVFVL